MAHWWQNYPWRMIQTNLREIDMQDVNAKSYVQSLKDFGATVVTLNAAGILASYDTKLDCQTKSEYLTGDSLRALVDECHAQGIRVIARTDFSKIRYPLYERHPDWAYRDRDGQIVNYNGDVQTCPNGEYQREKTLEILREVLTTHPFDGVFCNMSGFLVVDYSGVYHGPCHCESCRRMFKEQYGLEIPKVDDLKDPDYRKYAAFKAACTRANRQRLIETVKGVSEELAINGLDYIRTESNTEIGVPQWQYSASSNARQTAGPTRSRPADNTSVDFLGFRYRDTSVSPAQMALRQWQNLANAGSVSMYIMGRLDDHPDISGFAPTKRAFTFHKKHEKELAGLVSAARVLLVQGNVMARSNPEAYGWIRALTASHIPFDEVKLSELTADTLRGKTLAVLGDVRGITPAHAALLDHFAKTGGTVLATGATGVQGGRQLLQCLGVAEVKAYRTGLTSTVFAVREDEKKLFARCADAPYIAPGAEIWQAEYMPDTRQYLYTIPEHPFGPPERCYFTETLPDPGVCVHPYGQGKGILIPWLAGSFYHNEGYQNTLNLMQDVLFGLCALPDLAPGLTPMVELTLCQKPGQTVVQLVNASGCFANAYFEPLPVHDIRLVLPGVKGSAHALNGGLVQSTQNGDALELTLNVLKEYEMLVIS